MIHLKQVEFKKVQIILKYLWSQFWYILLYKDRRVVLVKFKNCTYKVFVGDKSEENYYNLNKILIKTLKFKTIECVVNGQPATLDSTYCGTFRVFSDIEMDQSNPHFNLDIKA